MPIETRKLIRQKRQQRGLWQRTRIAQYKKKRLIVYRNKLARTLLSERVTAGKCTATIWSFPRVMVAAWCKIRSVLNPKSSPYNYPTLVSSDEGGIKTRSVTTTEKLTTFASHLEGALPTKSRTTFLAGR